MNPGDQIPIKARSNPDSLLRLLVRTALISIVVVIIVSGYSFYRVYSDFIISKAKEDSVRLCNVMIDQQKHFLFRCLADQPIQLEVHENDLFPLDRNLRQFLRPFGILKIKIYDSSKRIIYSTDPKIIGKFDYKNARLKNALSGKVDAKLETKEKAHDLQEEQLLDVDVVETYVPIKDKAGAILGSFEVYVNVTPYRELVRHGVVIMVTLLFFVLVAVFGFSYMLMGRGTGQIKQAQKKLEQMAVTDMLTDIPNRSHLIMRGEEEFERIRRNRNRSMLVGELGCIMIDIDHFKNVNDTHGHLAGDNILKEVARRLSASVRPYDIIGRYGGEEFAALLPDASFEQSLMIAERILNSIRDESFEVGAERVKITVSLGVSCSSESDLVLNDLLKRGDEGLSKAKKSGRDRISWVYRPFDSEIHS